MESIIVVRFSVAETAQKGEKSCNSQPSRRSSLIRADVLASGGLPNPAISNYWPLVHMSISDMLSG
jgi:hypothetical protein